MNPPSDRSFTEAEIERNRDPQFPQYDPDEQTWVAPFLMGPINTRVVRRSLALFREWGESDLRQRKIMMEWLFWQIGGLGPMAGQNHHFCQYAPEKIPYAIDRYVRETNRLYGVMNRQLAENHYIAGDYSIADMACYPWIVPYERQQQNLADFPHLQHWFEALQKRPAVIQAYEKGHFLSDRPVVTEESRQILFGQTAQSIDQPS